MNTCERCLCPIIGRLVIPLAIGVLELARDAIASRARCAATTRPPPSV